MRTLNARKAKSVSSSTTSLRALFAGHAWRREDLYAVGSLIEEAPLYPNLTARENLNDLIEEDLPVKYEVVDRNHIPDDISIDRLPEDASENLRIVRIGDYDACPCIGKHVRSTSQIGKFVMLGTNWDEMNHSFRIRFKII